MNIKLEFKIKDKMINLTEKEAKELYNKLHSVFGCKEYKIPYPVYIPKHYKITPEFSPYWIKYSDGTYV